MSNQIKITVVITKERSLLQINPQCQIQCDVDLFLQNEGIDYYKGQFLQGFDLGGASGYDAWLLNIRESLRNENERCTRRMLWRFWGRLGLEKRTF